MNEWTPLGDDPAAELELADSLIGKADALLRKHRGAEPSAHHDDLPVLTDAVTDYDDQIPLLGEPVSAHAITPPSQPLARALLLEQLESIDVLISNEVEAWLNNELPQLLSRELDQLGARLRVETLAHLRATLLPTLSSHIASRIDELGR